MLSSILAGNTQASQPPKKNTDKNCCDENNPKVFAQVQSIENTNAELSSAKSSKETQIHLPYTKIKQLSHTIKVGEKLIKKGEIISKNLEFIGAVKLNGRNSSVASNLSTGETWYQTRNQVITPMRDQSKGFMSFASTGENKKLLGIAFNHIKKIASPEEVNAVIYGEWCGKGIMEGAAANDAINKLEPLFVVFDIGLFKEGKKECSFFPTKAVREIIKSAKDDVFSSGKGTSLNEARIFSIYEFGTRNIKIDFSDKKEKAKASAKSSQITHVVVGQCPVAKRLGEEGSGEGMVWRLDKGDENLSERMSGMLFKVVGSKHAESKGDELALSYVKKISSTDELIETVLTKNRMAKVLSELSAEHKNLLAFLQALTTNIVEEEGPRLAVSKIPIENVHTLINPKATKWFDNLHAK